MKAMWSALLLAPIPATVLAAPLTCPPSCNSDLARRLYNYCSFACCLEVQRLHALAAAAQQRAGRRDGDSETDALMPISVDSLPISLTPLEPLSSDLVPTQTSAASWLRPQSARTRWWHRADHSNVGAALLAWWLPSPAPSHSASLESSTDAIPENDNEQHNGSLASDLKLVDSSLEITGDRQQIPAPDAVPYRRPLTAGFDSRQAALDEVPYRKRPSSADAAYQGVTASGIEYRIRPASEDYQDARRPVNDILYRRPLATAEASRPASSQRNPMRPLIAASGRDDGRSGDDGLTSDFL